MQSINLSDLFSFSVRNEGDQVYVEFRLKMEGGFLVAEGQSPEELMGNPQYQLRLIDAFRSPLNDAKSVILTGDSFGIKRQKMEKVEKEWEEMEALREELAALKARRTVSLWPSPQEQK